MQICGQGYHKYSPQKQASFKGKEEIKKFNELPELEKDKFKRIGENFDIRNETQMALIGKKPSALFEVPIPYYKTLKNNKELLESDDIKIAVGNKIQRPSLLIDDGEKSRIAWGYSNGFIFNIPKLRKTVEKNLEFYRDKLGGTDKETISIDDDGNTRISSPKQKKLTEDEIIDKLTSEESPLFDRKNDDLLGVTLGYPLGDALMFHLDANISKNIHYINARQNEDSSSPQEVGGHIKLLDKFEEMVRPKRSEKKETFNKELGLPIPTFSPNTRYYPFVTWDKQTDDYKQVCKDIEEGVPEAKKLFRKPGDAFNYMLANSGSKTE